MAKRVLLLATTTGYQIRSFGDAAAKLGVQLVFASDRCDQLDDPWWDQAIPIRFHRQRESLAAIRAAFADRAPDGILAVGDRPTLIAALAAAAFALPGNPPSAATASRNKLASRAAFRAAGLPTPAFQAMPVTVDPAAVAAAVPYPAVLKPLALSGSRGVMRVDSAGEFVTAFERLRRLLHAADIELERDPAHAQVIVETFVAGAEFAIEGVLTAGALTVLAIFDKPDPLDGPFFEETIYVTPSRQTEAVQHRIADTVAAAARALGLQHGPIHAECRVNGDGVHVLEVAARPIGGLCSRALRFCSGNRRHTQWNGVATTAAEGRIALEEILLRHALGEDISGYAREPLASGVMMIPIPRRGVFRGVTGIDDARAVPGVDDVRITAKPDTLLVPLPEGRSYLGFIFAHDATAAGVEDALRRAHRALRFTVDRELGVI